MRSTRFPRAVSLLQSTLELIKAVQSNSMYSHGPFYVYRASRTSNSAFPSLLSTRFLCTSLFTFPVRSPPFSRSLTHLLDPSSRSCLLHRKGGEWLGCREARATRKLEMINKRRRRNGSLSTSDSDFSRKLGFSYRVDLRDQPFGRFLPGCWKGKEPSERGEMKLSRRCCSGVPLRLESLG